MTWKKAGENFYAKKTKFGTNAVYVDKFKDGYTIKHGQGRTNYNLYKTKKEAIEAMKRYMKIHK